MTDNVNEVLQEQQAITAEIITDKSFAINEELSCYDAGSEVCILICIHVISL